MCAMPGASFLGMIDNVFVTQPTDWGKSVGVVESLGFYVIYWTRVLYWTLGYKSKACSGTSCL